MNWLKRLLPSGSTPPTQAPSPKTIEGGPIFKAASKLGEIRLRRLLLEYESFWPLINDGNQSFAQRDFSKALKTFEEARAIAVNLDYDDLARVWKFSPLIIALWDLGKVAYELGDLESATRHYSEAKSIADRLTTHFPTNPTWSSHALVSLNKLGEIAMQSAHEARRRNDNLEMERFELDKASRYYRELAQTAEHLAHTNLAEHAEWHEYLNISLRKLAKIANQQGDDSAMLAFLLDAKENAQNIVASKPNDEAWLHRLSSTLVELGCHAESQGDPDDALSWFMEALEIGERLRSSDALKWRWWLHLLLVKLGDLAATQRDFEGAIEWYTKSKVLAEQSSKSLSDSENWQELVMSLLKLAVVAERKEDRAANEGYLKECFVMLHGLQKRGVSIQPYDETYQVLFAKFGSESDSRN